jgi:hypothetical protein
MTAQVPDWLTYQGKNQALFSLPLEPYLEVAGRRDALQGLHRNTACFRGYSAAWAIHEGALYLSSISGWWDEPLAPHRASDGPPARRELTLAHLFPHASGPILADWFTGELRCPVGKLLQRVHMDFESVYESELLLQVQAGRLVGESQRTNSAPQRPQRDALEIPAFLRKSP